MKYITLFFLLIFSLNSFSQQSGTFQSLRLLPTTLPTSCAPSNGNLRVNTSNNLLSYCSASNTWSPLKTFTQGNLTDVGTDGITVTGGSSAVFGSGTSVAQHVSDSSHNGYLASADWSTFNGKQSALTFTKSIVNSTGTVSLSGDASSPGNSQYYGTNASGIKGYYSLPTGAVYTAPTIQKFTSSSGTYTTPTSPAPLYIVVEMVGGGGGGSGAGTGGTVPAAGSGGNTTFGTSLLVANGGQGGLPGGTGTSQVGGLGGSASLGTGPIGIALTGGSGQGGSSQSNNSVLGGQGASSPFGGAGGGGSGDGSTHTGYAAIANTGSGGGGAAANTTNTSGAGGGAGGYVKAIISSPSSTYSYAVGGGGTAGAGGGGSGQAGGAGGSGVIIVTEYYQ